jgi:hypothetical protein
MRGGSSLGIVVVTTCLGALVSACLSGGFCNCERPAEIPLATLRITESDNHPDLVGADVHVTPGKVEIRTRNRLVIFSRVREPER